MLVFMAIWFTINDVPMAHMGWGGGWVFQLGAQDFAGGNVHVNVGIAALVGAWVVGARKGVGTSARAPHNMTMTMTGGSLLWVGWLAFCGGCVLAAKGFSMLVVLNTMLGAAAGTLSWMMVEWIHRGARAYWARSRARSPAWWRSRRPAASLAPWVPSPSA